MYREILLQRKISEFITRLRGRAFHYNPINKQKNIINESIYASNEFNLKSCRDPLINLDLLNFKKDLIYIIQKLKLQKIMFQNVNFSEMDGSSWELPIDSHPSPLASPPADSSAWGESLLLLPISSWIFFGNFINIKW